MERVADRRIPMPDKPALVLYASSYGQTQKVARRIAERLRDDGVIAEAVDVSAAGSIDLDSYGPVIVGGSVLAGRHQRKLVAWMKAHATTLNARTTAVFSVSLSAAGDEETAQGYLDALLQRTGVTAAQTATFPGALAYRKYNFVIRWLMRRIARKNGLPTDTGQNVDLTDWDAVDRFAHGPAERFDAAPVVPDR